MRAVTEVEDKSSFSPSSFFAQAGAGAYAAPVFAAEAPGLDASNLPDASTVARLSVLDHSAPVSAPRLDAPEGTAQGTPQPHMLESARFPISVAPAPLASLREPAALNGSAGEQVTRTVDDMQPPQGSVVAESWRASYDANNSPPTYIA